MITKQTKFIGGIAALLFVAVVASLVLGLYIITEQGEQLQKQMAMLATVNEQERSFTEIKRTLEDSAADRQALNRLFLTESDTTDFLSTIEQIARHLGLEITTESLQVVEPESGPDTLQISFSVAGSDTAIRSFITTLEVLPYGSYLTNVQLRKSREVGAAEANVQIAILLLPTYD